MLLCQSIDPPFPLFGVNSGRSTGTRIYEVQRKEYLCFFSGQSCLSVQGYEIMSLDYWESMLPPYFVDPKYSKVQILKANLWHTVFYVSMTVLSAHLWLASYYTENTNHVTLKIFRQRLHLDRWKDLDSSEVDVVLEAASRRQRRYLCLNEFEWKWKEQHDFGCNWNSNWYSPLLLDAYGRGFRHLWLYYGEQILC